ncbi:hypothetical protein A2935_02675 [Candidatus Wolfebacteria bacterium RIFCSPLOWO2_01_FULL_47_17b]|uniref:Uncharacterized protein n=1 Tax=Candidatus Wolfebacteria bacterium RIFCSPLOWO2_01_FULL_47_17b TaxID=1802558 RepID=A0A1F8DZ49_9BACT|nr:MAG: hypothetical protein A2935_02675 [Candidatus Wolfebacteria bacterium RIFCSPLOWO2_01_FULL_47_17b]
MMTYVVLSLLVGILIWRIVLPGMRLGASGGTPAAAPATAGGGATLTAPLPSARKFIVVNALSILIVLAGAVVVYWGFNTQVRPADMGSWGREYWFPLLILWGVLAALIALNAKALGTTAKTLQKLTAGVMFLLFVVVPVIAWIAEDGSGGQELKKPVLLMPANGDSPRVRTKPGYAIDYTGSGFTIHCVYRDGSEGIVGDQTCPCRDGPMRESYVRDTTGKANTATYVFIRPN